MSRIVQVDVALMEWYRKSFYQQAYVYSDKVQLYIVENRKRKVIIKCSDMSLMCQKCHVVCPNNFLILYSWTRRGHIAVGHPQHCNVGNNGLCPNYFLFYIIEHIITKLLLLQGIRRHDINTCQKPRWCIQIIFQF